MKHSLLFILVIITFMACRHDHASHHDHDHDHDDVKLLITGYNDNFEVFAEADPFVQGKTSAILAHFTHLEDFKPLQEGKVTLSIISGTSGIRQTHDKPSKPGIYRFRLMPETTGMARIVFDIEHAGNSYRLEGGNFRVFADEHEAIHAAEHLIPDHPAAVTFTKEQSWVVDFATAQAFRESLGIVIKTVGEIIPARGDEITLTAQTRGTINLANTSLYEGTQWRRGDVLLNISGEGLAEGNATQRYLEARNNYEKTKADFERLSGLADQQIVSQRALLEAKNDFENARAIFENLSRNFSESGQQVKSPVNGFLTQLHVSEGQFVEPGQPLATIAQNQNIVLKAEVQQRYASLLPDLVSANIKTPAGETYTLEELGGSILSSARNVNIQSHLLPVYLKIDNQHAWFTGSLVDVYLKSYSSESRIVVPNTSLVEEQGNYFVFVQIHPESFEKREVKVGNTDGIHTEILRGLTENERIVSRGALLIKMAAVSGDIDPHSGHVH
ncbi:MAG: efflux RND transporter periplasmic adaptor subunit [Bacteroidetes bacterium]|nr:MAG: efflux RND transporter periplasmic adaptor subunit [Bacteroidota bacterium]